MKRFHCDFQLQVYMYDFMYVDTKTIPEEEYFPATKKYAEKYKKISTPVPVPKHWLRFSYIRLEGYELDNNFDDKEFKNNQTTHPTIKLNYFTKIFR